MNTTADTGRSRPPPLVHHRDEPCRPRHSSSGWNCPATWSWARPSSPTTTTTAPSRASCEARSLVNPIVGEPRLPDAIRIADHNLADEVRAEVAGTIPVTVTPDPRARRPLPGPRRFDARPRRGTNPATSHTDASRPNSSRPSSPPAIPSSPSPAGPSPTTTRSCASTSTLSASTAPACRSLDSSARAEACSSFLHARTSNGSSRPPRREE